MNAAKSVAFWALLIACTHLVGCGSLGDAAAQGGEASLRTLIDLLLTDFTNQVADTLSGEEPSPTDGGDDQPGDGDAGDQPDDGMPPPDGDGGSAADGETIFSSNNCSPCHCADASGGCALSAPALVGAEASTLSDFLGGVSPHAGGQRELSEQDLLDLAAYLASL